MHQIFKSLLAPQTSKIMDLVVIIRGGLTFRLQNCCINSFLLVLTEAGRCHKILLIVNLYITINMPVLATDKVRSIIKIFVLWNFSLAQF